MNQTIVADKIIVESPAANMRPEVELLLCCARTCIDSERAERIKTLLQENIDWDYLIRTARSHGVMPLLYSSLNGTCPEAVPNAYSAQLRDYFYTNARRNLFLTGELLKLLNLFEAHGIRAIPYKGPVLAASAYNNFSLRQFCDLDILIHKQDILKTNNLLISQGYQLKLQLNWECHYVHQDSRVNVDLHWAITQRERPFRLDFNRLWSRLEPVSLAGAKVLNLQPEDLLLILCVQATKDCWQWNEQLAKVCDIAEAIRVHQGMDWDRLVKQAGKLGSQRMLFLGLLLARDLLGTALPKEILQRMQADEVVKALAEQVCERFFHADYRSRADSRPPKYIDIEKNLFSFRVRERLRDRVPYFLHLVNVAISPTPEDRAFLPLPAFLWFLYYLVRPIRAVGKYGLIPLKRRLGF